MSFGTSGSFTVLGYTTTASGLDPSTIQPRDPDLAKDSGASARTIERLFLEQTGLSPRTMDPMSKVAHAIELLAAGHSVVSTGLAVGYSGTGHLRCSKGSQKDGVNGARSRPNEPTNPPSVR